MEGRRAGGHREGLSLGNEHGLLRSTRFQDDTPEDKRAIQDVISLIDAIPSPSSTER